MYFRCNVAQCTCTTQVDLTPCGSPHRKRTFGPHASLHCDWQNDPLLGGALAVPVQSDCPSNPRPQEAWAQEAWAQEVWAQELSLHSFVG